MTEPAAHLPKLEILKLEILKLEKSLAEFVLDPQWKDLHLIEFDLKGELNPSKKLDSLFSATGDIPEFAKFCDEYTKNHFPAIKAIYYQLLEFRQNGNVDELKRIMGDYAFKNYQHDLKENASDEELKRSIFARLYRTLAGIYTEYHGYLMIARYFG